MNSDGRSPSRWGGAIFTTGFTLAVACLAAGCTSKDTPIVPVSATPAATPPPVAPLPPTLTQTPRQQLYGAIELLNNGNVTAARIQILGVLAQRPTDRIALDVLQQIDTDPRKLLGENSYAYQIRPGETLATIAGRFLGNPARFWALARYNNIDVPANAAPGQTIQIPGVIRAPASRPAPSVPAKSAPAAGAEPDKSVEPTANPAAASKLRSAGLAAMARGSIDKAVGLLQRALALNPTDTTISGDLARAKRIQDTVRRPGG